MGKITSAFQGGFQLGYQATSSWKQRKENKAKLDKEFELYQTNAKELANQFDTDRRNGGITQQEYEDGLSYWMPFGNEWVDRFSKLYDKSRKMSKEELGGEIEELKSFMEIARDNDYHDIDAFNEATSGFKSEKAINQANLYRKSISQPGKKQPETFTSKREAQEAYPNSEIKFNASKGVYYPEGDKPVEKMDVWDKKKKLQDELLANGEINREQYIKNLQQLGGGLQPTGDTWKQPTLGQIQTMEQEMLDAPNLDNLHNKLRQWKGANLDPETIKVYEKQWTDYQTTKRTKAIESTKKQLEKLLGEKDSLRPTDEIDLYVNGKKQTRTKEDWYKGLYDQYEKQYKALGELTGMEEFKKLISPEEMKTLWYTYGARQKGDWEKIWQD